MQELLTGKRRLPGFEGEWEVMRLGVLCSMKSGEGITAKSIDAVSLFPCYGGNGLRGFTSRFTHEGDYCLIGRVGALCGNLLKVTGQFFASEHAIVVSAFDNVDITWLTLALGMLNLNRRAESSAQPVLTVSKLERIEVDVPSTKQEQIAIAAVLSEMDAELAALEARRDKTREIKRGMMQELLTGRIRLQ
jgi:type I restriction enzyme S subunit